jgi:hypothetical protein
MSLQVKLTNVLGLPDPVVKAVANDEYSRGEADISITGLIQPARIAALVHKHWDELEEDVADRIWSLVGQVGHGILERSGENALTEERLFMQAGGWTISGQLDHFSLTSGALTDYKFVTVWKVIDGVPAEWVIQTNCYAYLLRRNGYAVEKIQILAVLRDWSVREARRRKEYPQQQAVLLDVPIWSDEACLQYIEERVKIHQAARAGDLPLCTSEERWEKPPKFALMKRGRQTALKLENSEADLLQYALDKGLAFTETHGDLTAINLKRDHYIERRDAEQTRCLDYCPVAQHCTWWQEHPDNPEKALEGLFA